MNRWTWVDGVTWACQPTEDAAFEAWANTHDWVKQEYVRQFGAQPSPANPRAYKLWEFNYKVFAVTYYSLDKDTRLFWRSPLGSWLNNCYQFNSRVMDFLKFPLRKIRSWIWRYSWLHRCTLVDIGHAKSVMETTAERYERWERAKQEGCSKIVTSSNPGTILKRKTTQG